MSTTRRWVSRLAFAGLLMMVCCGSDDDGADASVVDLSARACTSTENDFVALLANHAGCAVDGDCVAESAPCGTLLGGADGCVFFNRQALSQYQQLRAGWHYPECGMELCRGCNQQAACRGGRCAAGPLDASMH